MSRERNIYTLRPSGEALWLPESLAGALGIAERSRLTEAQFQHADIQRLLAVRLRVDARKSRD